MWNVTANIFEADGLQEILARVQEKDFTTFDAVEEHIFKTEIHIQGKNIIQIACNSGAELIYLKKSGAANCLGIDISEKFISAAKIIAEAAAQEVTFECTNIFEIDEKHFNKFHLVYITVGVLGWMPDVQNLFDIANKLLKRNGQLFLYEQHPILGMFNPKLPHIMDASYFQTEPFADEILPEYINKDMDSKELSYWFQHTLGAIFSALISNNFEIRHFQEYAKDVGDTYKILEKEMAQLPMSFTLVASKK